MNVRVVLMLSLFGLVVGLGSTTGLIPAGWETAVWAVISLVCAGVLARQAPGKFFLHGFLTGLISSAIATLLEAAMIGQYLEHNPKAAESFKLLPAISPAVMIVLMTPVAAAVSGVFTGFVTWLWALMTRPKPAAAA